MKLTKAQLRELQDLAGREYRSHYAPGYKPIQLLLELALVDRQDGKYGSATFAITPAGRLALETSNGK